MYFHHSNCASKITNFQHFLYFILSLHSSVYLLSSRRITKNIVRCRRNAYNILIKFYRTLRVGIRDKKSADTIIADLMEYYSLSEEKATSYYEKYSGQEKS